MTFFKEISFDTVKNIQFHFFTEFVANYSIGLEHKSIILFRLTLLKWQYRTLKNQRIVEIIG